MAEIEKNKYFPRNIFNITPGIDLTIGLSKYVKVKALVFLPFLRKIQLLSKLQNTSTISTIFSVKQGGFTLQGSESKFDTAYFTSPIPYQLYVKINWFQHFQVLRLWVAKDISENF